MNREFFREADFGGVFKRLYIVGQLHGALRDLEILDEMIAQEIMATPAKNSAVLHAGGYIDKGNGVPELLGALEHRNEIQEAPVIYLLGAHEWLMLRAMRGDSRASLQWLLSGAEASLDRWNVPTENWGANLATSIPGSQLDFLQRMPTCARIGDARFVCSTFIVEDARPFGLFGQQAEMGMPPSEQPLTAIGYHSDLMIRGAVPPAWSFCMGWTSGRVQCVVVERELP